MKGTPQRARQPAARKRRSQTVAHRADGKRETRIVLDERAQEQPADRETAQRSGRPSKRS
jgi:hypothetical protein